MQNLNMAAASKKLVIIGFLLSCLQLHSSTDHYNNGVDLCQVCEDAQDFCYVPDSPPHLCQPNVFNLGPEVYYVNRTREGGAKLTGPAAGVRFTYDYIKRYCIYCGLQASYGIGTLTGHSSTKDKIRARLTDAQLEGSLGYTFQLKCYPYIALTPYAGYGYFREVTKFSASSPLPVKFTLDYRYIAFGFLSSVVINPCLTVGLNARFRYPWQPRCKVTDDPEFADMRQQVGDCIQYRLELPFTYTGALLMPCFEVAFVPFYEYRLYGDRENYPFDFFKTKLKLFGLNLQFIYRF